MYKLCQLQLNKYWHKNKTKFIEATFNIHCFKNSTFLAVIIKQAIPLWSLIWATCETETSQICTDAAKTLSVPRMPIVGTSLQRAILSDLTSPLCKPWLLQNNTPHLKSSSISSQHACVSLVSLNNAGINGIPQLFRSGCLGSNFKHDSAVSLEVPAAY